MIVKRAILGTGILLLVVGGLVCNHVFREKTSFEAVSTSPDGMYQCRVKETYRSTGGCVTHIEVLAFDLDSRRWESMEQKDVHNDSLRRSNYSIDWEYDGDHRTTGLGVFGDFPRQPPLPGEIILERAFAP
jgi:hypothetical protein